jgi:hypothetical protein
VKVGDRANNRVTIISGLKAGDRVASSGQLKLSTGAIVTITESNALATPTHLHNN